MQSCRHKDKAKSSNVHAWHATRELAKLGNPRVSSANPLLWTCQNERKLSVTYCSV